MDAVEASGSMTGRIVKGPSGTEEAMEDSIEADMASIGLDLLLENECHMELDAVIIEDWDSSVTEDRISGIGNGSVNESTARGTFLGRGTFGRETAIEIEMCSRTGEGLNGIGSRGKGWKG